MYYIIGSTLDIQFYAWLCTALTKSVQQIRSFVNFHATLFHYKQPASGSSTNTKIIIHPITLFYQVSVSYVNG